MVVPFVWACSGGMEWVISSRPNGQKLAKVCEFPLQSKDPIYIYYTYTATMGDQFFGSTPKTGRSAGS